MTQVVVRLLPAPEAELAPSRAKKGAMLRALAFRIAEATAFLQWRGLVAKHQRCHAEEMWQIWLVQLSSSFEA